MTDLPEKQASPAAQANQAPRIRIHLQQDAVQGEDAGLTMNVLLPRLDPAVAKSLNRIHAGGGAFEFRIAETTWHVSWDPDPPPLAVTCRHRFQLGDAFGHLVLDPLAERQLLGDLASDVVPPDLRTLLLADALDAVFPYIEQQCSQPFRLVVADEHDGPRDAPGTTYLHLRVREHRSQATFHCAVQFDDVRHLALLHPPAHAAGTPHTEAWDWIPVPLLFQLGATALRLEELRQIAPGDIVRIDRWRTAGKGLAVSAPLPGARYAVAAHIVDTKIVVDRLEEDSMSNPKAGEAIAERAHSDAMLNDIEALEVTLTFELGAHAVTLGELRSLQPGHAIELAQPLQRSTIRILANGRAVGTGYLIALGDKLGVRISEFAKNDDV